MSKTCGKYFLIFFILAVCLALPPVCATGIQDYTTTYAIRLQDNGTALWNVEYRTPLSTDSETATFEQYTQALDSVYLPEIESLMQNSALQAEAATARQMAVGDFSGTSVIQTTPTGKFGVVTISFSWTNFAVSSGNTLSVGDAFAGGLYLSKDTILVIRHPAEYTEVSIDPAPDQQDSTSLTWYGMRSFNTGEPTIILERNSLPILPIAIVCIVIVVGGAGLVVYRRNRQKLLPGTPAVDIQEEPEESPTQLSEAERIGLEDRILLQLRASGGEQYQSELVKILGIPKSTLSSALNDLHQNGIIMKIKKGRENLIRLNEKYR